MSRLIFVFTFSLLFCSCQDLEWIITNPTGKTSPSVSSAPPKTNPHGKQVGPPAHAKAHGYRKKFNYKYYPDKQVYYSTEKKIYFWTDGKDWRFGVNLPVDINLDGQTDVNIELATERPYEEHGSVSVQYPSKSKGHAYGKSKGKGKSKNK